MTSALARRFMVDVSSDGVTWIPFKGIQDLAPTEKPTVQSTADYDTDGFDTKEKTLTAWTLVIKAQRPTTSGVFDPGQELVRARQYQFGDSARAYVRWYDRYNAPEAWSGRAIVTWVQSKTATADVEEITATFDGDGVLSAISNPVTNTNVPVITSATSTPTAQVAGGMVRVQGAYFSTPVATTGVKIGGVNATSWDLVSDSLLEFVVPTGTAGSAPIVITTAAGASAAFPYTRG